MLLFLVALGTDLVDKAVTMRHDAILIWGAGAIGGAVGAHLIKAGHEVIFVDVDPAQVERLNSTGLTITSADTSFHVPIRARLIRDLTDRHSRILLCVKAYQTVQAVRQLYPRLSDDGHVVSIQNGLNGPLINQLIGDGRVLVAVPSFGAVVTGPGQITYETGGDLVIGELSGKVTPRLQRMRDLLQCVEHSAQITDNIVGWCWGKLAYLSIIYCTALSNEPITACLARKEFRDLFLAVGTEAIVAARLERVTPMACRGFLPEAFQPLAPHQLADASLADMVRLQSGSCKPHSDAWMDIAVHGRKTEVDAHIGAVLDAAARHGLETPRCRRLMTLIHEIEEGRRPFALTNLEDVMRPADPTAGLTIDGLPIKGR